MSETIATRRSIRLFAPDPVERGLAEDLITLACMAPAPHHSRPWRFVHVAGTDARERLAEAMTDAWRADLVAGGEPVQNVDRLLQRSYSQVTGAPLLILSCLQLDERISWPDEARIAAERDMFMQSLGAALQNILLAATELGLVGYLKGAPLFCADAVRDALELPATWEPAFLVLLGFPADDAQVAPRDEFRIKDFLLER